MKLLQASTARDPMGLTAPDEAGHLSPNRDTMIARAGELSAIAAAGIVHDLGNLIQIAFSAINIVSRTPDMPAIHSGPVLARAKASLEQAGSIVRQCISQARDCSGATSVLECIVDVAALIETLDETGFILKCDVEPGLPQVDCDPVGLRRAVLNLVFNARDAIAGNGVIRIEARTFRHNLAATGVELRVADNGIGMSSATIARVFDPFFTTKSDGLGGVGLPMVEYFVREAGGRISIESELAVGTTVIVHLPAAAQADAPGVTVEMGTIRQESD